jgi:hypothetical protein
MTDWWDPNRSITGTSSNITALPSLGSGGNDLTYGTASTLAALTTLGTKNVVDMPGGNNNARFYSAAVGAQIGAGLSTPTPWTAAGVVRLSSIAATTYWMFLDDGAGPYNYQNIEAVNNGVLRPAQRHSDGTLSRPSLGTVNAANVTQAWVMRRNADSTFDFWRNGVQEASSVAWTVGSLNAMAMYTVGAQWDGSGAIVAEMVGVLGPQGFEPSALTDAQCVDIAGYLNGWGGT